MKFDLIVAMTKNGGIGKAGNMAWHCKDELKLFKEKTMDQILVMGRKTVKNLPQLKNRTIYCITRQSDIENIHRNWKNDVYCCSSLEIALQHVKNNHPDKTVYIAGGAEIYNLVFSKYKNKLNKVHISIMEENYDCDTFIQYPDFQNNNEWCTVNRVHNPLFNHTVYQYNAHGENKYLDVIRDVYENGKTRVGRNGEVRSIFAQHLKFDLRNGFPLLTTRRMFFRGIVEELLFFIRGDTDSKKLEEKNVNIWKGNTSRDFLNKLGMTTRREGVLGPCFPAGNLVLTKYGYRNIEDIRVGDIVMSHTGKYQTVTKLYKHVYEKPLRRVLTRFSKPLLCTPEHPFYVRKYRKQYDERDFIFSEPEWLEAEHLNSTYTIGMKVNTDNIIPTVNNYKINNNMEWYLMGFYTGSGRIDMDKKVHLLLDSYDYNVVYEKLSKLINMREVSKTLHFRQYICDEHVCSNLCKELGDSVTNKRIPEWIQSAPISKIKSFLEGFSDSVCKSSEDTDDVIRFNVDNLMIAYSLQRLYLKLGMFSRVYTNKGFRGVKTFHLDVEKNPNMLNKIEDGYAWMNVVYSEPVNNMDNEHTVVYNFDVENDHSYIVENAIVHNCYGYQWRHFNAPYNENTAQPLDERNPGIDQLAKVIDMIKSDPGSRRILMTDFNPSQVEQGVLYPCHSVILQFYVDDGYLDLFCYNRSSDLFHGLPFNIASTSLLFILIAKLTKLTPRYVNISLGDAHIYQDHYEHIEKLLHRKPYQLPKLHIDTDITSLKEIENLQVRDFILTDYQYHPGIRSDMVV